MVKLIISLYNSVEKYNLILLLINKNRMLFYSSFYFAALPIEQIDYCLQRPSSAMPIVRGLIAGDTIVRGPILSAAPIVHSPIVRSPIVRGPTICSPAVNYGITLFRN